ncbi:MAG: Fe-S cluster assembly ATPase SufC [Acidimicrobiia bacterium]
MSAPLFTIEDLHVRPTAADGADHPGADILTGVDLTVGEGELHALMGPNGSGKSTLANVLLGSPDYEITRGRITFRGDDITDWDPDVRGKAGIFLAFQYPQSIAGVSVINFLRQALSARKGIDLSVLELRLTIMEWMKRLDMDPSFGDRYLNEGFSGGEKKRNEILQMAILEPEMAILDETDSGLDIDALKVVARGVQEVRQDRPELGVLAITHYQRLLHHLVPDRVHILMGGRIVASGGPELAERLEREGYDSWRTPPEVTTP